MAFSSHSTPPHPGGYPDALYGASFQQSIRRFFARYADFSGHASRSEYWWSALAMAGVSILLNVIISVSAPANSGDLSVLMVFASFVALAVALGTIIPSLAIGVRRIRDAGFSGWMYLLILIPFFGGLIIFIFTLLPTKVVYR